MRRRRKREDDRFPAPLREFREEEWPPVPGECLLSYSCRGAGYGGPCVPRPGEPCGQRAYEHLAREYPDRPEMLAAAKRADAWTRFHEARLNWLGEDHPDHLDEMLAGWGTEHALRYPWKQGR